MDTKDTVVYLNLKFCYMTALVLVSRVTNSQAFKELREKRNVPKFEENEYPFQSSISSTQNLGCGVSRALENFFEYGVYRC